MTPENDATIIGRMRLILSGAALIVYLADMPGPVLSRMLVIDALGAYFLYSLVCCAINAVRPGSFFSGRYSHWLDIAWYTVFLTLTEPAGSALFLFFVFAILSASFRYGYLEGKWVTLASAAIYIAISLAAEVLFVPGAEWSRPLLRGAFLLVLGYMIARWGESEIVLRQKLTLMREVSHLSNPRFGVERTIASVMDNICRFFHADACIVIQHDGETDVWLMREAGRRVEGHAPRCSTLPAEAAAMLMNFGEDEIVAFVRRRLHFPASAAHGAYFHDNAAGWKWRRNDAVAAAADLLSAKGFFSAPLPGKKKNGRIYLSFSGGARRAADALFLAQVATHAFSTIDSIEVLDRLATEAAYEERRKIGRDLHDSTIQPYIGLKLGLEALQQQATADSPLLPAIGRLIALTSDVIRDLQGHVVRIRSAEQSPENALAASIERQVARFREFYGIDITVHAAASLDLNDRLAAEVVQLVNEGLSNIRKHTLANRGAVTLDTRDGMLVVHIENDRPAGPALAFVPRSITERAAALGGRASVEQNAGDRTVVAIEIPT